MKPLHRLKSSAVAAFTLLEVLVASSVLSVVLAIMFSALSTSMSLWRNTDNKIVADREARAVEFLLVRDLANVVMPASMELWPRIATNRSGRDNVYYLKFLTTAPASMQSGPAEQAQPGDVCYVEYAVLPSTNGPGGKGLGREVRRLFWNSMLTYSNIIGAARPAFPPLPQAAEQYQSLGLNLLPTNNMAARGLGTLVAEANNTNFVLLGTNMLPFVGALSTNNYPAAIEVNFSVADRTTLANSNITGNASYVLRSAGLYSFRIPLPKPPTAP